MFLMVNDNVDDPVSNFNHILLGNFHEECNESSYKADNEITDPSHEFGLVRITPSNEESRLHHVKVQTLLGLEAFV